MLERWWRQKYKLPSNHELFTSRTIIDLLVEFWEDIFIENPTKMLQAADGTFTETGDELIDKWERQIAQGEMPDLREAFPDGEIHKIARKVERNRPQTFRDSMSFGDTMDAVNAHLDQNRQSKLKPFG